MPPVEQASIPLSYEAAVKTIGELKSVSKARELPVVSDLGAYTNTLASQLNENAHVKTAKHLLEESFKTIADNQTFQQIQGKVIELNENAHVKKTLENVKGAAEHPRVKDTITKMGQAVEQLDTMAAGGIENLTARMPLLGAPTNELVETTKDAARSYFHLATEYLASFGLSQVGLKVADKTLSIAEKTTKLLHADVKDKSVAAFTYSKLRQSRRALRATKRAGERKAYLGKDSVARTGLVGSLASLLSVNSVLHLFGLQLVPEKKIQEVEEVVEDGDENHRQIGDLKGDLEGYKSDEDPDYVPEDNDSLDAESSSGSESEDELDGESKEDEYIVNPEAE